MTDTINYSTISLVELEGLQDFATQYNIPFDDPDLLRRYRMVEDGKRDVATKIAVAEKKAAEESRQQTLAEQVLNAMNKLQYSVETAMDFCEVAESEREDIKALVKEMLEEKPA